LLRHPWEITPTWERRAIWHRQSLSSNTVGKELMAWGVHHHSMSKKFLLLDHSNSLLDQTSFFKILWDTISVFPAKVQECLIRLATITTLSF
jgi:hypothetical protein